MHGNSPFLGSEYFFGQIKNFSNKTQGNSLLIWCFQEFTGVHQAYFREGLLGSWPFCAKKNRSGLSDKSVNDLYTLKSQFEASTKTKILVN